MLLLIYANEAEKSGISGAKVSLVARAPPGLHLGTTRVRPRCGPGAAQFLAQFLAQLVANARSKAGNQIYKFSYTSMAEKGFMRHLLFDLIII